MTSFLRGPQGQIPKAAVDRPAKNLTHPVAKSQPGIARSAWRRVARYAPFVPPQRGGAHSIFWPRSRRPESFRANHARSASRTCVAGIPGARPAYRASMVCRCLTG